MTTSQQVSSALSAMFERPEGLYGRFEDIPLISQYGHKRRVELLNVLDVGDLSTKTCVDFGMGSWGFGSVYAKMHVCARAIGMDISAAAIDMSKKLVSDTKPPYASVFETYESDGMKIPLPDATVDLFFSGESIEHVKLPQRYLSEIHRVLNNEGQVIITTPNKKAIKYREKGEEYCTSPEHFWLFDAVELVSMVSEFFEIREIYGFNGSFGSHEEDREEADPDRASDWSRRFKDEPEKATGIVLRATKKLDVSATYEIEDVPAYDMSIKGASTYLSLEFGLKGLLLDGDAESIAFLRPASDGMVIRLWCHGWSGIAQISAGEQKSEIDLYTKVPGWQNWTSNDATEGGDIISVSPTGCRNSKSKANQVIFFECFVWRRVDLSACHSTGSVIQKARPAVGYGFDRFQVFVGTTVFHWFGPTEGNLRGPWQPIGGRKCWDGSVSFWKKQIHEIMMANIDVIYLHLIPEYETYRINFFKAYAALRNMGWDVPKLAPFLDPFGIWRNSPIDLATEAGGNAFADEYVRFFQQYLQENSDTDAASFLLTIDGRLCLATWWVSLLPNAETFQRENLQARLFRTLGGEIPQLSTGLYMTTTALIDPDLNFSDERMIMFSGYAYAMHSVHKGVDVWHVQAGYWDQNIRTPGYFLPRDGGKNYRRAWDAVVSNKGQVSRVYIESWNEYDEGSGIYAADPGGLFIDQSMHDCKDTFSDNDDPYEYINTTAEGAARINGKPRLAATVVVGETSRSVAPGDQLAVRLVVRNEGNGRWMPSHLFSLLIAFGETRVSVDLDECAEASFSPAGVVRGETIQLRFSVRAPAVSGRTQLTAQLSHERTRFGEEFTAMVDVT